VKNAATLTRSGEIGLRLMLIFGTRFANRIFAVERLGDVDLKDWLVKRWKGVWLVGSDAQGGRG
jgi:hypothetical protein